MKGKQPYYIGDIVSYDGQLWRVEWCDRQRRIGYVNWNVMFKRLSDGEMAIYDMNGASIVEFLKAWQVSTPAFERLWK